MTNIHDPVKGVHFGGGLDFFKIIGNYGTVKHNVDEVIEFIFSMDNELRFTDVVQYAASIGMTASVLSRAYAYKILIEEHNEEVRKKNSEIMMQNSQTKIHRVSHEACAAHVLDIMQYSTLPGLILDWFVYENYAFLSNPGVSDLAIRRKFSSQINQTTLEPRKDYIISYVDYMKNPKKVGVYFEPQS